MKPHPTRDLDVYEVEVRTTTLSVYRAGAENTRAAESIAKDIEFHGFGKPRWSRRHVAVTRTKKAEKTA